MITLETLPNATAQEVFDQVATHLLNQGERAAEEEGGCMYRSPDGLKCGAGCLISDEEHKAFEDKEDSLEWNSWNDLVSSGKVPGNHEELISEIQAMHDNEHPDDWADGLTNMASRFRLEIKPELQSLIADYDKYAE